MLSNCSTPTKELKVASVYLVPSPILQRMASSNGRCHWCNSRRTLQSFLMQWYDSAFQEVSSKFCCHPQVRCICHQHSSLHRHKLILHQSAGVVRQPAPMHVNTRTLFLAFEDNNIHWHCCWRPWCSHALPLAEMCLRAPLIWIQLLLPLMGHFQIWSSCTIINSPDLLITGINLL